MTFSASGAAPTLLYQQYQESFGRTPAMLTIIFAAYVLSLLMSLLLTGSVYNDRYCAATEWPLLG
jgi:hypothetical protein